MGTTETLLTTAGSLAASIVLARTIANDLVPDEVRDYMYDTLASVFAHFSSNLMTFVIQEFDGLSTNQVYKAAETYLGTKVSPSTRRLRVVKLDDADVLDVTMERGEELVDVFQGIRFKWRLTSRETNHNPHRSRGRGRSFYHDTDTATELQSFTLTFHKKYKDLALKSYLPHVLKQCEAIKEEAKTLKLYTNNEEGSWTPVNLRHPATFATLAMDLEQKREVMEDLERFVKRKEYFKRIGKAWKRGYLLHGPPGTGKSSLIAAMANFLRFDVYDLELTDVWSNSALRSLLIGTANRSILVIEDIECSVDLVNREDKQKSSSPDDEIEKVTLSGLLNFVDGLWSSCGDERIIVFTTNYKDRIDPALLRPGRMDMHIHMGFCSPAAFRMLAKNYHCMDEHPLFGEIEGLIEEVEVSPAEVAEELMRSDEAETALRGVIKLLQRKKEASEAEAKAKGGDAEEQSEGQEIGKRWWKNGLKSIL